MWYLLAEHNGCTKIIAKRIHLLSDKIIFIRYAVETNNCDASRRPAFLGLTCGCQEYCREQLLGSSSNRK
jgi:hypothetical protein